MVLGLGLVFSVNANAGIKLLGTEIDLSFCKKKSDNYNILYPVLTKNLANHCTWEGGVQITYREYLRDPGPYAKKNICFNTRTRLINSRMFKT